MTSETTDSVGTDEAHQDREHPEIIIDDASYRAPAKEMTGEQLRHLPVPPIGEDYDLWLEERHGEDRLIGDHESVHLHDGSHFFSTPRHINPGCDRV